MIKFHNANAEIYVPDNAPVPEALARTTHLSIGAHQDDLEFMSLDGILDCYERDVRWFGGVTCTDGGGSARTGPYANTSDAEMKAIRVGEQNAAADLGKYGFMAHLQHPSSVVKNAAKRVALVDDIEAIIRATKPDLVSTHNPFDKHATHLGVMLATLDAIRRLPKADRPQRLIAYEGWRGLDWIMDDMKLLLSLDSNLQLGLDLAKLFKSQIAGGKRYDLAIEGRRRANATYFDSHTVDQVERMSYAIDLADLLADDDLTVKAYVKDIAEQFQNQMLGALDKVL